MPKSRVRKGHKKAVANYRKKIEDRRRSYEKQLRSLYEKQQQDALDKQINSGESLTEEVGIDASEFELQEDSHVENPIDIPSIVEGLNEPKP